jgi:hypothetical protein
MLWTLPFRRPFYNQRTSFLEYGRELESPVILHRFYKMITAHATNVPQNMRKYESYSRATVKNDSNDVTRISVDAQKSVSRLRVTSEWYVGGIQSYDRGPSTCIFNPPSRQVANCQIDSY